MHLPPIRELPVELASGSGAGVGVDENPLTGIHGYRQLQVEVAPCGAADPSAVDTLRKGGPRDPQLREAGHLLLFGGEPGELRVLYHEVEGEEPPEDDALGAVTPVADVLDSEGPVQAASEDVAQPGALPVCRVADARRPPRPRPAAHETMGGRAPHGDPVAVLGPREYAAVKTDESQPLRLGAGPAELHERLRPAGQVGVSEAARSPSSRLLRRRPLGPTGGRSRASPSDW